MRLGWELNRQPCNDGRRTQGYDTARILTSSIKYISKVAMTFPWMDMQIGNRDSGM